MPGEPLRIGGQDPFATPPERRDLAAGSAGGWSRPSACGPPAARPLGPA